eukprot:TRINITY_DN3499_c0_g8_i1.p1 TRINITY_DN3499_c0_g8~~TRINITY_DN3499_c0_g8_i1.p1  ORF type:complete len:730 (+),score=220.24 TRINITY_DN3499_c0_g8_i1:113-2302(+)
MKGSNGVGGTVATNKVVFATAPSALFYSSKPLVLDPFFDDYKNFSSKTPIVIDNGSYQCRAGWGSEQAPRLVFRSIVGKPKTVTKKDEANMIYVGSSLSEGDPAKITMKTPFDTNVVVNFDVQESILDHLFLHLGANNAQSTGNIDHPILMTEPVCNPNYSRKMMSELLFECYGVPSVCYGVDGAFSFHHNRTRRVYDVNQRRPIDCGLIIASGHHATHVMPIFSNRLVLNKSKRVSVGGAVLTDYLQKIVSLKYLYHKNVVTLPRAEEIKEKYCKVAQNYTDELKMFYENEEPNETIAIQLPIPAGAQTTVISEEEKAQKQQARREQGLRLKEMAEKRRKEQRELNEKTLAELLSIREEKNNKTISGLEFKKRIEALGLKSEAAVDKEIDRLQAAINRAAKKGKEEEEEEEEPIYPLLDIPDSELTEEQLKEKKKQKFLKITREGRAKAKILREEQKKKKEEERRQEEERRLQNPEKWVAEMKERRNNIIERKENRRKRIQMMSGRRGLAARKRMRLLTEAAFSETGEESFGEKDDDWNVYLSMQSEEYNLLEQEEDAEIAEIERQLKEQGVTFESDEPEGTTEEEYQLLIGVERIRVPEVLFQPSMFGIDQMGLPEVIFNVLSAFTPEEQSLLSKNILLTGGNVLFPGTRDRIVAEVRAIRPYDQPFDVFLAEDPLLDAWKGASLWTRDEQFHASCLTKLKYDEYGPDHKEMLKGSKPFFASNHQFF